MKKIIFSNKNVFYGIFSILIILFSTIPAKTNALNPPPLPIPPVATTDSAVPSINTAVISGTYESKDSEQISTKFLWGTTSSSLTNDTGYTVQTSKSGSFNATLTGLTPNTTYYYRAVTKVPMGGTNYPLAQTLSFTTLPNPVIPNVSTLDASPTTNSATINGHFSTSGSDPVSTKFLWGKSSSSLIYSTTFVEQSSNHDDFSVNITGLTPSTLYYYKAIAKSSGGTNSTAQVKSFTTDPAPLPCNLNYFKSDATDGKANVWDVVNLYWSQTNCTTLALSASDGSFSNTPVTGKTSIDSTALTGTTSFVLTGTDAYGNMSQLHLTITIDKNPNIPCNINSFTVNYSSFIQLYNGSFATIRWDTSSGCNNITISGNNGTNYTNLTNASSRQFGPFNTNVKYTLTAYDFAGNFQQKELAVNVYGNNDNNNDNSNDCTITSFVPSSSSINSGDTVNLSWSTTGSCTNVSIFGTSNSIPYSYNLPPNGSIKSNALFGTMTFNITANGNTSATYTPITVNVIGGPYPYNNGSTGKNAITSVATNIGAYSVKLNGVFVGASYPISAWFEYGTDTDVTSSTPPQNFPAGSTMAFYDTITTNPTITYYYRAVVQINGVISRGDIMTVITKDTSYKTTYVVSSSTPTPNPSGVTVIASTSTGVVLSITNPSDKIYIGDTIDYKISYTNGTDKKISNAVLNIVLPQGFTLVQTTRGQSTSPTMVTANIGTLDPGQTDSIFMQAKVENTVSISSTLVTNGTISFTYPNGSSDSSVGYVLNHAGGVASLGGFALGAGFFPTTILGWIVTILIILAVILTIRRISKGRHGGAALHH